MSIEINNNDLIAVELMPKSETIKLRNKHIGKSCQLFYRSDPLKIIRGEGQFMFDENGVKYLDCINNVAHVGHCHPKVVAAGCQQMSLLSTNNRFLHDELVTCAKTLLSKMPPQLTKCFFVNSGSEANDLALRLAKKFTRQTDVITLDHAYHGHLTSVMDISPYKFNQPFGDPKPDYVHVASCPDTYRGRYNTAMNPNADLAELYANEIKDIIKNVNANGRGVSCFIAESLQSCGGQILPPPGYFEKVYRHVHDANGVVIADEVQVGFGRVGSHYWGFETQNVVPDIVTVAKPMGNGYPVGAVVTTQKIADAFAASGICYFNTYGGNPVSCAIASAVMHVIETENLQENASTVGQYLLEAFHKLKCEYPTLIGDVRGIGLFLGIELILDGKVPATLEAKWIVDRMKNVHHVLLSSDGPDDNVLKLKPPMVFNIENANTFLTAITECFNALLTKADIKNVSLLPVTNGTCTTPVKQLQEQHNILIKSV